MIEWLTAFIDMPPNSFDAGIAFWEAATGFSRSAARGDAGQFTTLVAPTGDAFLRVQRVAVTEARVHLDIHVAEVPEGVRVALELGARVLVPGGHVVMSSPGGLTFCVVPHRGGAQRPAPFEAAGEGPSLVDQLSIDVPCGAFPAEVAFWAALSGYERRAASRPEFEALVRPPAMPLRLLFQRLGDDDPGTHARAHLDLAGGANIDSIAARHVELGAQVEHEESHWTTLRDPAGLPYCVTGRDPFTGLLG
ncbi:MAG TPA: VOC family protein [Ilumatobacteraceae bacterium]